MKGVNKQIIAITHERKREREQAIEGFGVKEHIVIVLGSNTWHFKEHM